MTAEPYPNLTCIARQRRKLIGGDSGFSAPSDLPTS